MIQEAREASADIRRELIKDEPNAIAVLQATSRLKLAFDWFLKKADLAVDSFAKAIGDTGGKATIAVAGVYITAEILPEIAQTVSQIVERATTWLQNVTFPF